MIAWSQGLHSAEAVKPAADATAVKAATAPAATAPAAPTSDKPASTPEGAKPAVATPPQTAGAAAPAKEASPPKGAFRKIAPGVMKEVGPKQEPKEAVSRHDVVELLAIDPNYDWAKNASFRRDVWALEFQFKPARVVRVDIPQPSGQMQRKAIWYLLYNVTNRGQSVHPVKTDDGTYRLDRVDAPVKFALSFLFESTNTGKQYPDRVIPLAVAAIQMREDPNRRLYNTAEVARELKVGETIWGVATWEDIDPRTNKFSVYVTGLTNAYEWSDAPGKFKKGDSLGTGRYLARKALKINFRRPGDEYDLSEQQIRLGGPGAVDFEWVYR
jgi:hypothetical protein